MVNLNSLLTQKLNKYLINIINQYNFFDIKKLPKEIPKEKLYTSFELNPDFTIKDILVKSIHRGYCGIFISKFYDFLIDEIDKIIDSNIHRSYNETQQVIFYSFLDDERNISYIDIFKLENVILKIDKIIKYI